MIHSAEFTDLPNPGKKFTLISIGLTWSFAILLDMIGWLSFEIKGLPFYAPLGFGSWCLMNGGAYRLDRFLLHYLWLFIIFVILSILYCHVIYTIQKTLSKSESTNTNCIKRANLSKKMIGFPFIFLIANLPMTIERLINAMNITEIPYVYTMIAICLYTSKGVLNSLLYGYTRKLFHTLKEGKK